ncbi:MAG: LysE family translocator [Deltaproteobacteria bacterium]
MDIHNIISFIAASIALTIMPGPDNIYVLIESITRGYKTGITISAGLVSGIIIHTMIASTGLAVLFLNSEFGVNTIKFCGSGYMLYLAYLAYKETDKQISLNKTSESDSFDFFSLYKKGFLMNIMNPKVTFFFIAFLPQFISTDGFSVPAQMFILGFIFIMQAFIIFSLISILASKLTGGIQNQVFWIVARWVKMLILSGLSIGLLLY